MIPKASLCIHPKPERLCESWDYCPNCSAIRYTRPVVPEHKVTNKYFMVWQENETPLWYQNHLEEEKSDA